MLLLLIPSVTLWLMQKHNEHFRDWEYEAEKVKDGLGNKINRMSKRDIEAHIELSYLSKILIEIFLDLKEEEGINKPMEASPLNPL